MWVQCHVLLVPLIITVLWPSLFLIVSSNIDKPLSTNPSSTLLVFGYVIIHELELIDWVNSATIFLSQMSLFTLLTFQIRSLTVISTLFLFELLDYSVFSVLTLPPLGNIWYCHCLSFHWHSFKTQCMVGVSRFWNCVDTSKCSQWAQAEIDAFTSHHRYQVKPQSSSRF